MTFLQRLQTRTLVFDTPDDGGGGGDPPNRLDPEVLLAKYEDKEKAVRVLAGKLDDVEADNAKLRKQRRELRKQVPGEGTIVLSPEQAEVLQELGALGEDGDLQTDQLTERLSEAEDAQEELHSLRRRESQREACEVAGLNADAAGDILPSDLEFKVTGEGDDRRAVIVTDDGETPLSDYVEENYSSATQTALFADESSNGGTSTSGSGGTSVVRQTRKGDDAAKSSSGDPVEDFLSKANERRAGKKSDD